MALIIDLKPQERIIIGNALITNDKARTRLHIEGDAPILREKDIMRENEAISPCQRIYYTLQLMYLSATPKDLHDAYFQQIRDVQEAAPSTSLHFMRMNDHIINGHYYKALKEARALVDYEQELMGNVKSA